MIELKDVSYVYHLSDTDGNRIINPVISHLSMTIPGGEFVVLTGSSGCGKTTLCRMINGLVPHYFEGELKGKILVDGEEVSSQPIYQTAKKVGSVFQNPRSQFFNVDTTSELAFTAENQGRNPESILHDIKDVTKKLNIETLLDRSMFQLSGGEKQKIACGSVAVADQPVIVLDEPTSNLDMEAIKDLEIILEKWKKAGKTIVIAEHRLFFLRNLADRVFVLEDGALKHELTGKQFRELQIEEMEDMGLRTDSLSKVMLKNTAQKSDTYIKIHNVKFTYSDKIHGIDIPEANIPANRVIGIIGHNGAGKSTFAKTLCGLNRKAKGNVTIKDETILAKKMSEHCYMIAQDVNHMLFTESVLHQIIIF
ncbi:ABC transporter ATP-binding protein [[Ruminococcus] torques]|uniref:ABC transporter ATP-binding protein n=1 Tax=[Ruminococcus] torques TaxID=33039 RepID=UPI003AB9769B